MGCNFERAILMFETDTAEFCNMQSFVVNKKHKMPYLGTYILTFEENYSDI